MTKRALVVVALLFLAGCSPAHNPVACHGDVACEPHQAVLFTADSARVRAFGDTLADFDYVGPLLRFRGNEIYTVYYVVWAVCTPLCQ